MSQKLLERVTSIEAYHQIDKGTRKSKGLVVLFRYFTSKNASAECKYLYDLGSGMRIWQGCSGTSWKFDVKKGELQVSDRTN